MNIIHLGETGIVTVQNGFGALSVQRCDMDTAEKCVSKCPYELDTPALLKKNYEDYKKVLKGEVKV